MTDILLSASCDLKLTSRRLGRLLHELVQHDDPSIHDRAIEDPRDPLCRFEAEFEQPAAHRACMGHAEVQATTEV